MSAAELLSRLRTGMPDIRVNGLIGRADLPGGAHELVKFWITNDACLVYGEDAGQVVLLAGADIVGFTPSDGAVPRGEPYVVTTVDGETWKLTQTGNCGCSSPLKGFSPFLIQTKGT